VDTNEPPPVLVAISWNGACTVRPNVNAGARRRLRANRRRSRAQDTPEGESFRTITSFMEGRILPPEERMDFLTLPPDPEHPEVFQRFDRVRHELDIHVCYCSVLEECWTMSRGAREPQPVRSCEGSEPVSR
jgi:hypothetical protein